MRFHKGAEVRCQTCANSFTDEEEARQAIRCRRCEEIDRLEPYGVNAALPCWHKAGERGHDRKSFTFGGDGWACAVSSSSYDSLSGSESHRCGRRGVAHVTPGPGRGIAGGGQCAVVCNKHLKWLLGGDSIGHHVRLV